MAESMAPRLEDLLVCALVEWTREALGKGEEKDTIVLPQTCQGTWPRHLFSLEEWWTVMSLLAPAVVPIPGFEQCLDPRYRTEVADLPEAQEFQKGWTVEIEVGGEV